jgi:hypothetical protein
MAFLGIEAIPNPFDVAANVGNTIYDKAGDIYRDISGITSSENAVQAMQEAVDAAITSQQDATAQIATQQQILEEYFNGDFQAYYDTMVDYAQTAYPDAQAKILEAVENLRSQYYEGDLKGYLNQYQSAMAPYTQAGSGAVQQQQALSGALGPEAQAAAIQQIQQSPGYQAMLDAGETSILQNASATGGLRGGNTQAALAQFAPQLLGQEIDRRYAQLGDLSSIGMKAGIDVGKAGMDVGQAGIDTGQVGVDAAGTGFDFATSMADVLGSGLDMGKLGLGVYGLDTVALGLQGAQNIAGTTMEGGEATAAGELNKYTLGRDTIFDLLNAALKGASAMQGV